MFTESDFLFTETARRRPKKSSSRWIHLRKCSRGPETWWRVFSSGCILTSSSSDYLFTESDFLFTKTPEGGQKISFDHWFHVRVQTLARSDGITQIRLILDPFGMISDLMFTDHDFMFTRPERVPPDVWVIGSVQEWSVAALGRRRPAAVVSEVHISCWSQSAHFSN